jgi:hypothetical protein
VAKKNAKNTERRAMVEQMRAEQARKERMRSLAILGTCIVIVVALLGVAVFKYVKDTNHDRAIAKTPISHLGVSEAAAACDPVVTRKPTGNARSGSNGSHVNVGTKLTYPFNPPAFGQHWPNFLQASEYRNFYSAADRPELERLVHSLEHGHTRIWYDDTITTGSKAYKDLQAIADKFNGTTDYINIVPWLSSDGGAFPGGKHVALTHWTGPQDKQMGVWEYCGQPSGKVIQDFIKKYPNSDSPEPGAM